MEKADVPKTIVLSKSNMQVVLFPTAVMINRTTMLPHMFEVFNFNHLKVDLQLSCVILLMIDLYVLF